MKNSALILLCTASILLSGCVGRKQADTLLAESCAAGVQTFLPEREKVEGIEKQTVTDNTTMGLGHRDVSITLKINDGFTQTNKDYSCIFAEQFGVMGMTYTAAIYQLKMNDKIIGQDGLSIAGTPEEVEKLNAAVTGILNK